MIIIIHGYRYDTELPLEEQDVEFIKFIVDWISDNTPTFNFDESNRPFEYVYKVDDSVEIVKRQEFIAPSPSCEISGETTFVRGVEIWHEPNYCTQVKLTFQEQIDLLRAYPDFALYTSESNLPTHVEKDTLYTYDNTLCQEYRDLLQYFGGIITDKN